MPVVILEHWCYERVYTLSKVNQTFVKHHSYPKIFWKIATMKIFSRASEKVSVMMAVLVKS